MHVMLCYVIVTYVCHTQKMCGFLVLPRWANQFYFALEICSLRCSLLILFKEYLGKSYFGKPAKSKKAYGSTEVSQVRERSVRHFR